MLYAGSSKITPLIYSEGGTATLTVVNHSSFDRSTNEKVFLNQITGGWEIIDYASADINSITAKCDENIAKNATGTVSLSANGQLMNHEIRDFILGSNLSESNVNDDSKLITCSLNQANKYIIGDNVNYTYSDFRVKIKFKFISANSEVTTLIPFGMGLLRLNYSDSTSTSLTNNLPSFTIYYSNNNKNFDMGVYTGGSNRGPKISNEEYLILDNWITVDFLYEYDTKYGTLRISDGFGHDNEQRTYTNISTSSSKICRCLLGNMFVSDQPNYKLVLDLNNCGIYTGNNEPIWTPYKEIIA